MREQKEISLKVAEVAKHVSSETSHDKVDSSSSASGNDEGDMAQLLRGVNCLTVTTHKPEFYGASSARIITSAIEVEETVDGEPSYPGYQSEDKVNLWHRVGTAELSYTQVDDLTVLSRAAAEQYINQYTHTVHRLHPILEMTHFLDRSRNFWDSLPTEGKGYELWAAVLYMTLALGHQASTLDPDPKVRNAALEVNHGEICFLLARKALSNIAFDGGDISVVNGFVLGVGLPRLYSDHC